MCTIHLFDSDTKVPKQTKRQTDKHGETDSQAAKHSSHIMCTIEA